MSELNKKFELQMEVLTPLHVGAGAEKDWVKGADFVDDNGKIKVLDLKKISEHIPISELTKALLDKDDKFLKTKLSNHLDECVVVGKIFNVKYSGSNDIKTFIKNGLTNKPIVPGSSIKGALRSILLYYLMDESSKQQRKLDEKTIFGKANEGDEFMRFIKVSDAHFDNTEICNTKIFNLKSTTEGGWKHGTNNTTEKYIDNEFNTFYEVIEPKQKARMNISLARKAFENFDFKELYQSQKGKVNNDKKKDIITKQTEIKKIETLENSINSKSIIINSTLCNLFKLINQHSKSYLQKEKAFFEKYTTDKTDKIIEGINSLIQQIPENGDYCIMKMAAGSGFHSITGDWQFDDFSIDRLFSEFKDKNTGKFKTKSRGNKLIDGKYEESAKSRKIAIYKNQFTLMGFIKLTHLDEKTLALIEQEKEKERQNELIKLQQQQEEQRQLEQQKAEIEAKNNNLKSLISEAQSFFDNKDYTSAFIKITEAESLNIESLLLKELKQDVLEAIKIQDQLEIIEKQKQDETAKRIAETEAKLSLGLTAYLEEKNLKNELIVQNFGMLKAKVEKYLKDAALTKVPENEWEVLKANIIRVYTGLKSRDQKDWQKFENNKIWNEIAKWTSFEFAKSIYNKMF